MKTRIAFAKNRGLFVTATDTGVGKTVVSAAIADNLYQNGIRPGVFKPFASGCRLSREGLVSPDAEFLSHCGRCCLPLDQVNPIRYRHPLAPLVAAEKADRPVDWLALETAYRNMTQQNDLVIVEGIGGAMVPLAENYLVLDLMVDMQLPVLIVARSNLGTLNHTLMTIEICRSRGLKIIGVVLNRYSPDLADLAEETNARVISETSGVPVLTVVPYDKKCNEKKGRLGGDIQRAIAMVNWDEYISVPR